MRQNSGFNNRENIGPCLTSSLRTKRSNPDFRRGDSLDCFGAIAPRNDGAAERNGRDKPGHRDEETTTSTILLERQRRLYSVPIMIRLVRAVLLDADVIGLVLAQLGQLDADLRQMQPRHLFVQRLG